MNILNGANNDNCNIRDEMKNHFKAGIFVVMML
jgi:hypothetical protein